jgi:hypothetical protein
MPPLSWGRMIPHILPPIYMVYAGSLLVRFFRSAPILVLMCSPASRSLSMRAIAQPISALSRLWHSPSSRSGRIPNILLVKKCQARLLFLNRNARTVDAKFNTLRLGFLTVSINTKGNYGDYERADDEVKCVLFHGWPSILHVRECASRQLDGVRAPNYPAIGQDPARRIICIHGRCSLLAAGLACEPGSPQSTPLEARRSRRALFNELVLAIWRVTPLARTVVGLE